MKLKILYLFILFMFSLNIINYGKKINNNSISEKFIYYGKLKLILPIIDGMKECKSNQFVQSKLKSTNYSNNIILGFYVNNSTYKNINEIENIKIDDYAQIYASKKLEFININQQFFNEVSKTIQEGYIKENWEELKNKINFNNIIVSRPIIIDTYSSNNNSSSYVIFTRYENENNENFMLIIMNLIKIKNKLIYVSYYKNYDGEESIKKAKGKNDFIIYRLIEENK